MKKMTTLVLACIFAVFSFTGCSSQNEEANSISSATGVNGVDAANGANAGNSADVDNFTAATSTVPARNVSEVDSNSHETETTTSSTTTTVTTTAAPKTTTKATGIGTVKSRKRRAFDTGDMLVLEVKNIQMLPELPAGSEITSAAIALNYFGVKVDKMDLINYLPMASSGDPNEVFVGNPTVKGSYCYPGALKKCIENYLKANNISRLEVVDTVIDFDALTGEIYNDGLVLLWVTEEMKSTGAMNCSVMNGYNLNENFIIINDPNDFIQNIYYPREQVEAAYKQMGSMALVIREKY